MNRPQIRACATILLPSFLEDSEEMTHVQRGLLTGMVALFGASCGGGDKSIALYFPNESARAATKRIVVEGYSPDTGIASSEQRTCATIERTMGGSAPGTTTVTTMRPTGTQRGQRWRWSSGTIRS